MGPAPTARHLQDVDEIYFFRVGNGKLVGAFGVEDNLARMRSADSTVEASRIQRTRPVVLQMPARALGPVQPKSPQAGAIAGAIVFTLLITVGAGPELARDRNSSLEETFSATSIDQRDQRTGLPQP